MADKPKKAHPKKMCENCKKTLSVVGFYNSNSKLSSDGKTNFCKTCIKKMIDENNMETLYNVLKAIDKPFLEDLWIKCKESKDETVGTYLRLINSLPQYKYLSWSENNSNNKKSFNENSVFDIGDIQFKVTRDMVLEWGTKYEPEDYHKLQKFVDDMKLSNNIETAQDIVYLKKLAVISLNLDKALEEGRSGEAKQLGDLFSKYMADSKFRAMDKTDADKTGGIRNFSSIYAEVEKDGFIPPWEHYRKIKGITQDIVDKTIMHIENFTLKLNRVEKMMTPPDDTPKLTPEETDVYGKIEINDINVDKNDGIDEGDNDGILE